MDVERIIDDIEQLQEMFEALDTRPLSASDLAATNRTHDDKLANSPWFRLWQRYNPAPVPDRAAPSVAVDGHFDGHFGFAPDISRVKWKCERGACVPARLVSI
jgi:hypothetical protein